MTDYFAALAARTLRPELSVQPRQRVRWEEASEPIADAFPATEKRIADGARPSASDEEEPPRRSRRTLTADRIAAASEPVESLQKRGKRKDAGDRDHTNALAAPTPHPTVRAVDPAVQVPFERVAARPDAAGKNPAVASDRSATSARAGGIERARRMPTRLSARERESTAEPAIRIHIGRVDVRAVTGVPGPSPPASRDSKRALMSLDEYIQKRDRGTS